MAEVFHDEGRQKKSYIRCKAFRMAKEVPFKVPFKLVPVLLIASLFSVLLTDYAICLGKRNILNNQTVFSDRFRRHSLSEDMIQDMRNMDETERGEAAGLYILDHWNHLGGARSVFGSGTAGTRSESAELFWQDRPAWDAYQRVCNAIWNDVVYFPVPASTSHEDYTVSYVDSWMGERNFGGTRGHEGTDLMASEDEPGLYPVVSMTEGTVTSMGWLPKGGYRIGITAPSGGYFYYAHLDSYADLEEGDAVDAGDILGFMGDSGYGPEGTTGMFATHLHVGIYVYPDERETSINPYWILRMIEEKKLSCSF